MSGRCKLRLHIGLLSDHFARFPGDLGRIRGFTILFMLHFLQIFMPSELICDLVVHELGKLAGSI